MNHIYKVIWNTITQTWVAVSEISRAKGKTKSSKTLSAVVLAAVSAGAIVGDVEAANAVGTGNDSSLVFGQGSKAFYELEGRRYFANNAVALGTSAHARVNEDVAIGNAAISGAPVKFKTDENGNFVLEKGQKIPVFHTSEEASVAVGTNAKAEVVATTAIGAHANALGIYSTAVGAGAKAENANSSAFGQGAMATADYSTAIGKSAHAKEQYSIALGKESQAETGYSTSVGFKTEAKGLSSLALGSGMVPLTDITGDGKVNEDDVAKQRTIADGDGAFAAGASANAKGSYASALSAESTAKGDYAFAAGAESKATANNATALGKKANASGDSAVAVGANAQASNNYDAAFGSNATASGSYSSAFGQKSKATAADASAFGNESKALAINATSVGAHSKVDTGATYGSALGREASVTAANGTALGSLSSVTAENGTAVGTSATVSTPGGVALGQGSASTRAALDGKNITISSQGNVVLSNHITDKDNSAVTDVYAPVKLINDPKVLERVKNTIHGNAGAVSLGKDGETTRQLTNLAPGSADSDAVNVAQLKAVVGTIKHYNVTSKGGDITVNSDATDPNKTVWDLKINPKYKIKYFSVKSAGGTNENDDGATATDAIAIGKDAASSANNAVVIGKSATALKNDEQYDLNVGKAKSNADSAVVIGNGATSKQARTVAIGNAATTLHTSAIAIGDKAYSNGARGIAIGRNAQSTGNNSIALGAGDQNDGNQTTAEKDYAVAIGFGAIANITNGIALGSESKTTADKGQTGFDASQDADGARVNKYDNLTKNKQNVRTSTLAGLSIGDTGKTRQINHLAAGTADDDAVNVAQLKSVNLAFKGDNNTKGDVRLHDQRLSVVGVADSFITTKASDNKLEIRTTQGTFSTTDGKSSSTTPGLATTTAVANAINESGWEVQAKGDKVGLVNPGDKVNFTNADKSIEIESAVETSGLSTIKFKAVTETIQTEEKSPITQIDVNGSTVSKTIKGKNKPTGRFVVPTGDKANKYALATAYDVADKVNQTGWNLYTNGGAPALINPGDYVNFKSGNATNANVVTEASEGATISYDVNVDNTTIKIDPDGNKLAANTGDVDSVTNTNGNSRKGQVTIHKDPLEPSKTDAGKLATVDTVVKAVNNATWYAKAGNNKDAEVSEEDIKADETANKSAAMKAGETLGLKAGKNLRVKRNGADFTFALNNTVDLTDKGSLTIGGTTVTNDGVTITAKEAGKTNVTLTANGLDNGGNKIVNVAAGENDNDAVNYKQLKDSISTEKVKAAEAKTGDENIATVTPAKDATGYGEKNTTYEVSVSKNMVKDIAKTAVKVVNGKNTTVTPGDDSTDNSKTYAVDVKGNLTDITSITNTAGSGKVEFKDNGIVNVAGDSPIKLDGKTGDITGLTNTTLGGESFAKSGRAATEEQLNIVNKKFDNKVSLGGDSGETDKKALSTDGGIKFNVKAATGNKVVTTEATGDDVNIKFSGEEAAKVTNLSYKANNGDAKKVTLENGLDFTNGTHTTAEVGDNGVVKFNVNTATVTVPPAQPDTFTGKFEAPATDGVATIKNVVDVVNNSGWKISEGADSRGIVKAGDEVSFVGTGGTIVTVEGTSGKRTVTVSSTLGAGEKGEITAVTQDNKVGAEKVGQVKPKSDKDDNKVTTVKNVADMINSAKWFAKASNTTDEVTDANKTDDTDNADGHAMSAGDKLTLKAGKNLRVKRDGADFTFALNNTVDLTDKGSLTIGGTTVTNDGVTITAKEAGKTNVTLTANGLDNGGNKIVNVAAGEDDNDAVNYKQLKDTELHIAPTKANGETSGVTYTYDDETKSVTLKYKDGNGKVIENTEAKIDLSGLASKIKDYSFKTNATGSNLVETGTETTVASGKSVNFAASDNLTLKQDVKDGNVTYTYDLKNQVVVGEKGTPGADGKPGKDGVDGSIGVNGKDGSAVAINGKDGSIGLNGKDGKNGLTIKGDKGAVGVDGTNGKDGKDGMTRIVYTDNNNVKHEVATLDDGQKYAGDNYVAAKDNQAESNVIAKKANDRLDIVGGAKGNLTEDNIGVNAKDGKLHVQLAEKVNLGNKGLVTIGDTVVNNNGITINSSADPNGVTNKTVSLTNQGLNNGGNKIVNVAEGTKDTDAVNVKQLNDFKSEVAEGGLTFAGNSGDAHKAKLNSTVNIKGGEGNTDADQFDNGKNVMTKVNGNTVTVSIKKTPEVEGINIIDTTGKVKVKLTQTDEGLKVSDGNNNATRITNVKAGEKDTDAVNVKQLNAVKTEVTAGDNIDVRSSTGANGQTIYKVSAKGINDTSAVVKAGSNHVEVTKAANTHKDGSTTVTDYTVDLSKETKEDIGKGVKAYDKVTNEGLTFNADQGSTDVKKLGSTVSVKGDGKNITTTANKNGVTVSMKDDINVNSVTANKVKVGDVNINENGINAGGKRITNVAPGKDGTDAVNVNQLKYVAGNISNQINNVDKGLRAGIAGALASGGLYHVTTAGKSMVSVGAGTYRGQNALAVGYSRLSDNGKVGVKFTVNSNSQGHSGASASVGYQW